MEKDVHHDDAPSESVLERLRKNQVIRVTGILAVRAALEQNRADWRKLPATGDRASLPAVPEQLVPGSTQHLA